jgi:hypothetical protein
LPIAGAGFTSFALRPFAGDILRQAKWLGRWPSRLVVSRAQSQAVVNIAKRKHL